MTPDEYAGLRLPEQWIEDIMQETEAAWILEQLKNCSTVLDLGWGSGIVARALAAAGKQVTVVDGAADFCAEAARVPGVQAIHSLFEDFQPVGRYDCVIASFILEHVQRPRDLLGRVRKWTDQLIVVAGNANSYHRQLAVQMGLQPTLETLSARDVAVGHHFVYDRQRLYNDVLYAGWVPVKERGLMFKPLPNGLLQTLDPKVIRAMCELDVPPEVAANVGLVCVG